MSIFLIVIKIIAGILLIPASVFFIKQISQYNSRYRAMVDFLRIQNDRETLSKIGYVEFYGEEYGLRRSVSKTDALLRLYEQYNKTKLQEYLDYANYLKKQPFPTLGLGASIFILLVVFFSI